MSVEQTTQLIQLILNSVLMSITCALVLVGLTARHRTLTQQLQRSHRPATWLDGDRDSDYAMTDLSRSRFGQGRSQMRWVGVCYRMSRYSVLSAYYALLFSIMSCFALVLRALMEWNGLIPVSLGCFVIGIAALLVAVGLTLLDWHLGDRALLNEVQKLLHTKPEPYLTRQRSCPGSPKSRTALRSPRQKMRVG